MRSLLYGAIAMLSIATLQTTITLREIEDRAVEGDRAAIIMLRDSAEAGNLRAMNFLGFVYWQGLGTEIRQDSALFFLRKASDLGDVKASANLGHLLLTGSENIAVDTIQALHLLDYAASRQSTSAMRELADYFAVNPGDSTSAPIMKKVADSFARGHLLPYNYRRSIELYNRAAELGDTASKRIISEYLEFFPDALKLISN